MRTTAIRPALNDETGSRIRLPVSFLAVSFGPTCAGADVDFQGDIQLVWLLHALANDINDLTDFVLWGYSLTVWSWSDRSFSNCCRE